VGVLSACSLRIHRSRRKVSCGSGSCSCSSSRLLQ
jgi:hypothetical protein